MNLSFRFSLPTNSVVQVSLDTKPFLGPQALLFHAAYVFWVTWAFVSGKSPKCIEREGQGRRRTGNRQTKLSEVLKGLKTSEPTGQCVTMFARSF